MWKKYLIIVMILFLSCICILNTHTQVSIKHEKDYSTIDILNAQKIALGIKSANKHQLEKYDMNIDGEITHTDIQIIQHFLIHIYDKYITVTTNSKTYVFLIGNKMEEVYYGQ